MSEEVQTGTAVPRRQMLCGVVALGLLGPAALAGCSSDNKDNSYGSGNSSNPPAGGGAPPSQSGGAQGGDPKVLAKLADVPVGGGKIVTGADGSPIVVVQPAAGQVKAYSAVCTHAGTTVGAPQNGIMTCPNHGSKFKADDGSVAKGPASSPLNKIEVQVAGDSITVV